MDYKLLCILVVFGVLTQANGQEYKCQYTNENIDNYWRRIMCKNATLNDLLLFMEKFPVDDNGVKRSISISFQESHISDLAASSELPIITRYQSRLYFDYENNDIDNVYINVTQRLLNNRIRNIKNSPPRNIKNINLSNNLIEKVNQGTFSNLTIDRIDLAGCDIATIEPKSFINIRGIDWINLSRNKLQRIFSNTFTEILMSSYLKIFSNNAFDLSNNRIEFIEINSFVNMVDVEVLKLTNNSLTVFNTNWFKNIESIKILNLERNKISNIIVETSNTDGSIISISNLNLAFNQIEYVRGKFFSKFTNLRGINLLGNPIKMIEPYAFQSLTSIRDDYETFGKDPWTFNLGKVNMSIIDANIFTGLKRLVTLNLSEWNIETIEPFAFSDCNSLKRLILSHNNISTIQPNTFANLDNLKALDLSYNKLTTIEKKYFEGLKGLNAQLYNSENDYKTGTSSGSSPLVYFKLGYRTEVILNLEYNQIEEIQADAFQYICTINTLNLSGNNLKNLSIGLFKGLENLSKLDLSFNKLYQLRKEVLYPLKSLANLNLAGNNLVRLDIKDILTHYRQDVFERININDNMWDCDHLFEMIRSLSEHKIDFTSSNPEHFHSENVHGIACYQNKSKGLMSDYALEHEFLENHKTIASASRTQTVLLILILFVTASIFVFILIFYLSPNYARLQNLFMTYSVSPQNPNSQSTMELFNVEN